MAVLLKPRWLCPRPYGQTTALGERSFIIDDSSRQHHWQGIGCLSLKSFAGGEALYDVGRGRFRVTPSSYLLLNQNQPYEISVEASTAVTSFCLFFEDGLVEEVAYCAHTPASQLLDNPAPPNHTPLYFFEKTYPHDDLVSPALFRFRDQLPYHQEEEGWINEQLHLVLRQLLLAQARVRQEIESLPALRAATRQELYQRLQRAREFIAASFEQPLTLDQMARIACLSSSHFLRSFQQAFRQTPHQFLTALRLERAQMLLQHTDLPVTEICYAVGFESLGSFSTRFRRQFGLAPIQFRRAKR
jgi:AraC family transcriptional regulator